MGFALHGLWPQLDGGDYPTQCSTVPLGEGDGERYRRAYADPSLIAHEWLKHGTCAGLPPAAYFALSVRALSWIRIPSVYGPGAVLTAADSGTLRAAFMSANPGLSPSAIRTIASRGLLTGVEICLTKAGAFRSC
jgi:ribonuclease T2